jgi:hypothetical protein
MTKFILSVLLISITHSFNNTIYTHIVVKDKETDYVKIDNCDTNNIIIGDSQSPYVDWGSEKFNLLNENSGVKSLWEGGRTLNWLLSGVRKYKMDSTVCNVAICIGTNGGFNKKDSISELVNQLHIKFPKSKLFVIQGSWGWGGVSNKTESVVREYYKEFEKVGVIIVNPPIGKIEPHGRKPIYKEIGNNLDSLIKIF